MTPSVVRSVVQAEGVGKAQGPVASASGSLRLAGLASLEGRVTGPAGLVANNAAALVANGAGGLVANGAGSRRTMSLFPQEPVTRALVYLATPEGRFLVDGEGRILSTVTDEEGRFLLPQVPDKGLALIQIMLSRQRRLMGYVRLSGGARQVVVDMATTLVTEALRDHARNRGVSFADLVPSDIDPLVLRTRALLNAGAFGPVVPERDDPDLSLPGLPALINRYLAMTARDPALQSLWAGILGYRPYALSPVAEAFLAQARTAAYRPAGLAWDEAGARMALALRGASETRIVVWQPSSLVGSSSIDAVTWHGDRGTGFRMLNPDGLVWMASGSLWVADGYQAKARPEALPAYLTRLDGPGKVFRLFLKPSEGGQVGEVWGMAMAPDGSLWLADGSRHVLRRIAAQDLYPAVVKDGIGLATASVMVGQPDDGGWVDGPAATARFNYPMGLAFDGEDLIVADRDNHRVRRVVGAASGQPIRVGTFVGGGMVRDTKGLPGLPADEGLAPLDAVLKHPDLVAMAPDGRLVVSMADRVIRVGATGIETLTMPAWGRFAEGEARRVVTGERLGMVLAGTDLWLSATDGPGVSRLAMGLAP
ncbi:MAG: hypothetical protein FJY99_05690 [Candidatus Sericytochromatia bacterium]|nr:hypothetical protein [Candidatus Tanganyikabacteria bacterium]